MPGLRLYSGLIKGPRIDWYFHRLGLEALPHILGLSVDFVGKCIVGTTMVTCFMRAVRTIR